MTSVSGLDSKRNGSARYQSRMLRRLSTFPSHCWAFVHASESIYKRARFGGGKPSTASIREYAFQPVCVSRAPAFSCMCRCIALSVPGVTRKRSVRSFDTAKPATIKVPKTAAVRYRFERKADAASGAAATSKSVDSEPAHSRRTVTSNAPSDAPIRSAK